MNVSSSFPTTKGGGRCRVTPDIVEIRLKNYYRKKNRLLSQLPKSEREKVVWVLSNQFSWPNSQIKSLLHVSLRTIERDLDMAKFLEKRNATYREELLIIDRYILYLADYIPLDQAVANK